LNFKSTTPVRAWVSINKKNIIKLNIKVSLITGGGIGIDRDIFLELARQGVNIAISSRNVDNLNKTCKEIERIGRRSLSIPADVCIKKQADKMVEKVIEKFIHIDVLANSSSTTIK